MTGIARSDIHEERTKSDAQRKRTKVITKKIQGGERETTTTLDREKKRVTKVSRILTGQIGQRKIVREDKKEELREHRQTKEGSSGQILQRIEGGLLASKNYRVRTMVRRGQRED